MTLPVKLFLKNYRWGVLGLVIGWFILTGPGLARANGGTTLWVEQAGAYEISVTGSPFPLEVGVNNDISVLLGRLSDAQIVLDAQVTMIAEPVNQSGQPQTFSLTHDKATNKLYYATDITFPTTGQWKLTVQVGGPEGSASTTFEVEVVQRQPLSFLRYLWPASLPLVVILLLFFILNQRAKKGFNSDSEGETE